MAFVSFIDWLQGGVKLDPKFDIHVGAIQEKLAQVKQNKQLVDHDTDANQALMTSLDKHPSVAEPNTNKQQTYLLFPGMFDDPKDMLEVAFSLFVKSGGTANILLFQETFEAGKIPEPIDLDEKAVRIVRDIRTEIDRIAEENKKRITALQQMAEENKQTSQGQAAQRKKPGMTARRKQQSLVDVHSAPKSQFPILVAYSSGAYSTVKAASLLQSEGQKSKVFILDEPEFSIARKDAYSQDHFKIKRTIQDLMTIAKIAFEKLGITDLANAGIKIGTITERLEIAPYDKRVNLFFSRLIAAIQSSTALDSDTKSQLIFTLKVAERTIMTTIVKYDELQNPYPVEEIHVLMLEETKARYSTSNSGGWEKWCKRVIDLDPDNKSGLKQQSHLDLPSTTNAELFASLILSHLSKELEPDTELEANLHRGFTHLDRDIAQAITEGISPDTIQRIFMEKIRATVLRTMKVNDAAAPEATPLDDATSRDNHAEQEDDMVLRDEKLTFFGRYNPNGATAANRKRSLSMAAPSSTNAAQPGNEQANADVQKRSPSPNQGNF